MIKIKRFIIPIVAVSMLFSIVGCGEQKTDKSVTLSADDFMQEVKSMDDELWEKVFSDETAEIFSNEAIKEYLVKCAEDIEYTIGNADEENMCVSVKCEYDDSEQIIVQYLSGVFDYYLNSAATEGAMTEEKNAEIFETAVSECESVKKSVQLDLQFEEADGEIVLKEIPKGIDDIMSAGIVDAINSFAEQVKAMQEGE